MNEIRTLLTGRGLVESPRWHDDRLFFSDWSTGEVIAVDLAGRSEVVARVQSLPLCTAWLPTGQLVIVSSAEGQLLRRQPDGSLVTHTDLGKAGWNDIVVDVRGNAYVNAIGFDLMAGAEFKPGFISLLTPDGSTGRWPTTSRSPTGWR
jgi:sugar lactone lactonase YvrE